MCPGRPAGGKGSKILKICPRGSWMTPCQWFLKVGVPTNSDLVNLNQTFYVHNRMKFNVKIFALLRSSVKCIPLLDHF